MIAICGVSAVFLSQCEQFKFKRWASVVGLMAQPFWFIATLKAEQYGVMALCFFYGAAWAKGFYTYWIARRAPPINGSAKETPDGT